MLNLSTNILAYASDSAHTEQMDDISSINALRLLQAGDQFRARLSSEFSAVHGLSVNEFFLLMHLDTATSNRFAFQDRWTKEELTNLSELLYRLVLGSSGNLS